MSKSEIDQLHKISETVCSIMNVSIDEMRGDSAKRKIGDARKVLCVAAKLFGYRSKEIADYLNYPDHTGVVRCQEAFTHLIGTHEPIRNGFRETMNVLLT